MNDIFVNRKIDIKQAAQAIAYIPLVPGLEEVHQLHSKEVESWTFGQSLTLLCGMLKHESASVRVLALKRLTTGLFVSVYFLECLQYGNIMIYFCIINTSILTNSSLY